MATYGQVARERRAWDDWARARDRLAMVGRIVGTKGAGGSALRAPPEQGCRSEPTVRQPDEAPSRGRPATSLSIVYQDRPASGATHARAGSGDNGHDTALTGRVTRTLAENDKEAAPARGPAPLRRFVFAAPQRLTTRTRTRPLLRGGVPSWQGSWRPGRRRPCTVHRPRPSPTSAGVRTAQDSRTRTRMRQAAG